MVPSRAALVRTAAGLAAMAAVAGSCPAFARGGGQGWDSYANSRFNYAICFPPTFEGQGEATDRDGQVFRSPDGARLAVFGADEEPGAPLDADLAATTTEIAGRGARTSYRAHGRNWLVASGVGPGGEFYLKRVRRRDQELSFELVYPASLHARYAPIAGKIAACFTFGADEGEP